MTSLQKYLIQKETQKDYEEAKVGRFSLPAKSQVDRTLGLEQFFPNESDENLALFASMFSSKEEMDQAVENILKTGSSIQNYIKDWNLVQGRKRKPKQNQNQQQGSQGKSSQEKRKYKKKEIQPEKPQNYSKPSSKPSSNPSSKPISKTASYASSQASHSRNDSAAQQTIEIEAPKIIQEAEKAPEQIEIKVDLLKEENPQFSVIDEEQTEKFIGRQFSHKSEESEASKKKDAADFQCQAEIETKEVGVQVSQESGIPCMIVPLQDRDFFRIENLIYPKHY